MHKFFLSLCERILFSIQDIGIVWITLHIFSFHLEVYNSKCIDCLCSVNYSHRHIVALLQSAKEIYSPFVHLHSILECVKSYKNYIKESYKPAILKFMSCIANQIWLSVLTNRNQHFKVVVLLQIPHFQLIFSMTN